ncbi:MAG TPA: hypothetical protein VHQ01_08390 [Pyrinomonadaceae bacterium]|jgi:hypothetical protein|nr:hypothetical protein [Pyrinomonadaceae bacterium]
MNGFRIIGAIVSLAGSGIFILALLGSLPQTKTNASAGIGAVGPIHFIELFLGAVLVVIGLSVAIIGGRSKKLP